ncbi:MULTISPECIES: DUF7344 domain-containing protein [Halorussus]|uniref:DUF7344 domain-containing protein n=1 Tax=Halorussus TaxID=1070314 RepID=UPI0020A099D9|nr:hypothetical protein [Halorussus vallis]USZ76776.1 hypothetical protein NGM07_05475 [Halorussus vallis]
MDDPPRTANADGPTAVSDALHWALTDDRRRAALAYLRSRDSATLSELADDLAAADADAQAETLRLSFARHHLPVLAASGLVEYDERDKRVALADLSDDARQHVERVLDER